MISLRGHCCRNSCTLKNLNSKHFCENPFHQHLSNLKSMDAHSYSLNPINSTLRPIHYLTQPHFDIVPKVASSGFLGIYERFSLHKFYSSPSQSFRRRENKRLESSRKPTLNEAQFQRSVSQLLPRFTPEELCDVITKQDDPLVCLELFNWASQQSRFKHDVNSYHITIKKLGVAKMYE
ncbi:hypothetical protein RchiOBHm_Chr7g0223121 [Rosa chinensis]|uniref:Uncharacterized protein n=1 Tax=Rosa chinensis TaxID=74649 RepID=A0A2P6PDH0_ROSCH|nr:hypothetical protein RchiOBHm_Chr7g0223121 [Rosa chinensis]